MKHTLVTFLGRGRDTKETPYRKANYRFSDGTTKETEFFGLALAEHLQPDAIVILGTRGSQWGALVEHVATQDGDEYQEARIELLEAEPKFAVDQDLLDRVTPLMKERTRCDVLPRLIPYGESLGEQYGILATIADPKVVPDGTVSFDLTHGFRHLAMVGFLSAFMLERVRSLEVKDLWYGAVDMTKGGAKPVLKLDGLVRVRRWVAALERYDATGDLGMFEPLLVADGVPQDKAKCLTNASFYERILNVPAAENRVRTFLSYLSQRTAPLGGASGLFREELEKRLRWVNQGQPWQRQRELAYQYLNRHDFVRAAMLGWEACINRWCQNQNNGRPVDQFRFDPKLRTTATTELTSNGAGERQIAHQNLQRIRNSLAHTTRPRQRSAEYLNDPVRLRNALDDAFRICLAD